jgi:hypothetical protein
MRTSTTAAKEMAATATIAAIIQFRFFMFTSVDFRLSPPIYRDCPPCANRKESGDGWTAGFPNARGRSSMGAK